MQISGLHLPPTAVTNIKLLIHTAGLAVSADVIHYNSDECKSIYLLTSVLTYDK